MRRTIYITPRGPARPVSADPLEPVDRGEAPRWRACDASDDAVKVRLPRRLSTRRLAAGDDLRWVRGQLPDGWLEATPSRIPDVWERAYRGRGLGFPKRLPHSRRPGYAPVLNIHANGYILLDDQHVAIARRVEAEFHREVICEHDIGQVVQTLRPGATTAKVTIELETSAAGYEAFRTVAYARYNGSPNLRATAKGGAGYAGTITRYTYEPGPRFATVTLDLVMVTITTSTIQTG